MIGVWGLNLSVRPGTCRQVLRQAMACCSVAALLLTAAPLGGFAATASTITEPAGGAVLDKTIIPQPPHRALAVSMAGPGTELVKPGNPLWAVPLRDLTATRDRPLFSPTRRPPAPAVAFVPAPVRMQAPPEPDRPRLTLLGTVVGGSTGIGVFLDQSNKHVIRLVIGQAHDGWALRAVHERDAVFKRRGRESVLALPASGAVPGQHVVTALNSVAGPSGTWTDGDGQLISPPRLADGVQPALSASPAATWQDGDGQLISPPMARN